MSDLADLRHEIPLSLAEARGVAQQIRKGPRVDRQYWPWVVEKLCKRLEAAEAILKQLAGATCALGDQWPLVLEARKLLAENEPPEPPRAA